MKLSNLCKRALFFGLGGIFMASSMVAAHPIRTPDGNMPLVHWAVIESTPGGLKTMGDLGAKLIAPQTAKESGTYVLYAGTDKSNPDKMRILELYESYEAYRIHVSSEAFQDYRAARFPLLKNRIILEANGIALEQKANGTATAVLMHRYEVKPEKLAEYQQYAKEEAIRAVREDDGVMGMFVTAETANPNIIHTMELYADQSAYQKYAESEKYKLFLRQTGNMFISAHEVDNLPTKIILSTKGLKVSA